MTVFGGSRYENTSTSFAKTSYIINSTKIKIEGKGADVTCSFFFFVFFFLFFKSVICEKAKDKYMICDNLLSVICLAKFNSEYPVICDMSVS